jgi:hypothetical protein
MFTVLKFTEMGYVGEKNITGRNQPPAEISALFGRFEG